jgi:hypothetical protein
MKIKFFTGFYKSLLLLSFIGISYFAYSQNDPSWLIDSWRIEQYPSSVFITGFVQDGINKNETIAEATERVKNMARANLSESILASVQSVSDSYSKSIIEKNAKTFNETVTETLQSQIKVSSKLDINGIRVESYVKNNMVYGFAFANKYEVIGYYKANLNLKVQQIEGFINTATELENNREKKKAKDEFNKTLPIFTEIAEAQGILSALDKNISDDDLKMQKTMSLYNEVAQANARLAQGINIYMTTNEDLFGDPASSIENNLKAILSKNGCNFVTDTETADWKIDISASSRQYNRADGIYYSYVDAAVKLYKAPSEKHVYQNEISEKGGHNKSYKDAARKAYDEISIQISNEILPLINN